MTVRIRSAQLMFNAKVAYESTPTFTDPLDIVDKQYVDDIAAYGVTWKQPVSVLTIKGSADTEPVNPNPGDAWLVSTTWSGFAVGTIVEYNGTSWVQIVAGSGGEPPNGTRVAVASGATTPFNGHDYDLATYDATGDAWSFEDPEDGDAVLVKAGYYENRAFVYDTTSYWIQIAGPGQYTAGDGIDISGQAISVLLSDGDGDGQYPGLEINATDKGLALLSQPGGGLSVSAGGVYDKNVQLVATAGLYDFVAAEPGSPVAGQSYVATAASTWTGSINVVAGDVLYYTSNGWRKIVSGSGGFVPVNYRFLVDNSAVDELSTLQGKVIVSNGTSLDPTTWDSVAPLVGMQVVVSNTYNARGTIYIRDGNSWSLAPKLQNVSGLTKDWDSGLAVYPKTTGGLALDGFGVYIKLPANSGLATDSNGLAVDAGTDIKITSAGVSVDETYPWHRPVHIVYLITDLDQGGSPPANPINGCTYIVDNWGGGYTDGDTYQYIGGNWVKLYDTGGSGKPATGLRAVIYSTPEVGSSFAGKGLQLAWYDGTSWSFQAPDDGDVIYIADAADGFTPANAFWGDGAAMQYQGADWNPLLSKFKEQSDTNWPANTTTWDLDEKPAQLDEDTLMDGALAVYYNGQRLLRTAGTGGGQGTYYMQDADTVKFDFTPTSGSTMEAVIGFWS